MANELIYSSLGDHTTRSPIKTTIFIELKIVIGSVDDSLSAARVASSMGFWLDLM